MSSALSGRVAGVPAWINRAIWAWFAVVAVYALFSAPFHALQLLLQGRWTSVTLPVCAAFAAAATIAAWRHAAAMARLLRAAGARLAAIERRAWLAYVIAGGIVLRLAWLAAFPTVQVSDAASYTLLAQRLADGGSYFTADTYANWPPALPFFLAAQFLVFGSEPWVVPFSNLLLYTISVLVVYRLGLEVGGEPTARLATVLLAIWPNHIMTTGLAEKEMLVIPLISGVLLAYLLAARSPAPRNGLWLAGASGVLTGVASLAQPSLVLFPAALAAYQLARGEGMRTLLVRMVVVAIGVVVAIAPWTVRNYLVLDAFVPISTAGGKALYLANNPLATGGYASSSEKSLDDFDELTANRLGFKWGVQWIAANPLGFVKLMFAKQIVFLGDDSDGAYWGIKKGGTGSAVAFVLMKGLSNAYWLAMMFLMFAAVRAHWGSPEGLLADVSLLMLSLLYAFSIDSVFEAGARHHTQMIGALVVLAALLASAPRTAPA